MLAQDLTYCAILIPLESIRDVKRSMRIRARTKDVDEIASEIKRRLDTHGMIDPLPEERDPDLPGQGMFPCYEVIQDILLR